MIIIDIMIIIKITILKVKIPMDASLPAQWSIFLQNKIKKFFV